MKIHSFFALSLAVAVLAGCATPRQQPVSLNRDAIGPQAGRIAVAMTELPKREMLTPGADCLLCLASARMLNSSLIDHIRSLPLEDLPNLRNEAAELLRKQGARVVVVDEPLDVSALSGWDGKGQDLAVKDFSPLREKYGADRLLVFDIQALGLIRNYSAYIPTGDPRANLIGTGYMVELNSNHYDWYLPVTITRSTDRNWDESPAFPGLTNAYFQVLELGREEFLKPFAADGVKAVASSGNPAGGAR
ncbi:MAG: hypothetical protein AB1899_11855 [Pseudomonadota bacterium]